MPKGMGRPRGPPPARRGNTEGTHIFHTAQCRRERRDIVRIDRSDNHPIFEPEAVIGKPVAHVGYSKAVARYELLQILLRHCIAPVESDKVMRIEMGGLLGFNPAEEGEGSYCQQRPEHGGEIESEAN